MQALKDATGISWLKKKIEARMGLKFVVALTAVIAVLLVLGAVFVSRILMEGQYRAIETRGRELGLFLGKAGTDPLLHKDIITLDGLVAEAVKTQDVLYTYISDPSNTVLSNPYVSFNRTNPRVKEVLAKERSEDVPQLAEAVRSKLDAVDVRVDIRIGSTVLGAVRMGFSREGVRAEAWSVIRLLLLISALVVGALGLLVHVMVRSMIVLPTAEAVGVASNIAAGDLSQSVRVRSVDELGTLGRGLNRMIIGLKGMIGNVREASRKTEDIWREVKGISSEITGGSAVQTESVEEASSSVNEMHFSLTEIAGNVADLSRTSEQTSSSVIELAASIDEVARTMSELSASIEETSTSIAQMSAAVRQIAENVTELSSASEETAASAAEISASVKEVESNALESVSLAEAVTADAQQLGMRSIEKTIAGMTRIEQTARRTADVVNRLGERAENIGGILTVIEDITDQTSLLALNAAILAAQAGEHGKGFAVVATEIRELANRTAASTKEISTLITSVQEESRDAVEVMREEFVMVEEGVLLAHDAGEALTKIVERADRSRNMSRSISKAAAEQSRGIRQVSESIDKISDMARQIARATNEQKNGSEQITQASEKMRQLTRAVKNSTDQQARGGKDITHAVESMTGKIKMVNRATGEVQAGSDLIVKSIDRIKEIAKANADLSAGLNSAMDVMVTQAETLKREIEKFKT